MKKLFAMLIVVYLALGSTVALADWSPSDEFEFQVNWYTREEPNTHKEELPKWIGEIEEELSAPSKFAVGGDYVVAFVPIRYLSYNRDKSETSMALNRDDHLIVLNRRTGFIYEYRSSGWLSYDNMCGLNELYSTTSIPYYLFEDMGSMFSSIAPEEIFKFLIREYDLTQCTCEELLQQVANLEISFQPMTTSQQNLYRLMCSYMEPMCEGEGELDCFAFSPEHAILYFLPEEGSEDDVAEAVIYYFVSDSLEYKTLTYGEFNKLAEDCLKLYFW